MSRRRQRGSLAAFVGGLLHLVIPSLVVLPQDASGPTIGVPATTYGVWVIGVVAIAGALLGPISQFAGRVLVLVAAILSAFLIFWEFEFFVLALTAPLLASVWWLFLTDSEESEHSNGRRALIAGALGAAVSGYLISRMLHAYNRRQEPSHPESVAVKPPWDSEWLWVGGVTATAAKVRSGGAAPGATALTYWAEGATTRSSTAGTKTENGVAQFELEGLEPATRYRYAVHADGTEPDDADSQFRTAAEAAQNLTIAFASCARTGSNGAVFDAIRATDPDLFVQLGDLHYGNLTSNRSADHIEMLGRSLSTPAQSALYSSVPSMWIWDDHDYGPNDSDSTSPARGAVLAAYRQAVPHWSVDPDPDTPINQAFTLGRVRIVSCDTRSMRTAGSMLGTDQEQWLIDELVESSNNHALVVWANPTPWNFPEVEGSDVWGGFPEERRRIANALAEEGVSNLVMISGDWHLSAIDDGTNTGYADDGSPGFPLIHGAPLDRPGVGTGEDYSHGIYTNAGQFGTIEVTDDGGSSIDVLLAVHLWNGERLGELSLNFPVE